MPNSGDRSWRCSAAGGRAIVRAVAGVGEHHLDPLERHAQFLSRSLRQFASRTLAGIHFAGKYSDRAVIGKMKPRRERGRWATQKAATATPAALAEGWCPDRCHKHTRPEQLHEPAAIECEVKPNRLEEFVVVDDFKISEFGLRIVD